MSEIGQCCHLIHQCVIFVCRSDHRGDRRDDRRDDYRSSSSNNKSSSHRSGDRDQDNNKYSSKDNNRDNKSSVPPRHAANKSAAAKSASSAEYDDR